MSTHEIPIIARGAHNARENDVDRVNVKDSPRVHAARTHGRDGARAKALAAPRDRLVK
jgi:hypothetical protein